MIFGLNCKPFSLAHTDRKNGNKYIPCYTGHSHIQKNLLL